jgi:hypothetical protein
MLSREYWQAEPLSGDMDLPLAGGFYAREAKRSLVDDGDLLT